MENIKLAPNYSRYLNEFSITIKQGSQEKIYFAPNAEDIERIALKETGIDISYNYHTDTWGIPEENNPNYNELNRTKNIRKLQEQSRLLKRGRHFAKGPFIKIKDRSKSN